MAERTLDGLAAARARGRTGGQKPKLGPFRHQRLLEFCDRTEDLEEHPAHRGGGVDAVVEHAAVDPAGLQEL